MASTEEHVRGGMEILGWAYRLRDWESLLRRRRGYLERHLRLDWTGRPISDEPWGMLMHLERKPLRSVMFTSTGVITDHHICAWFHHRQQLDFLALVSAGWDALVMRFTAASFWGTYPTVVVPVPKKLLSDAGELCQLLEHKVRRPEGAAIGPR